MTETIHNIKITEEQRIILLSALDAIDFENQPESPSKSYMVYIAIFAGAMGLLSVTAGTIIMPDQPSSLLLFCGAFLAILAKIART